MTIDGFAVVTQTLGFLVLLGLMKWFLFKPVLHAVEVRDAGIREDLANTEAKRIQAQIDGNEFRLKNDVFDRERQGPLAKAAQGAKAMRRDILEAARTETDIFAQERKDALQADYVQLARELGRKARREVFAVARKTLAHLGAADLQKRIAMVFAQRLRDMDESTKDIFAEALKTTTEPALVRSAFELDESGRDLVCAALNETFHAEIQVRFETSPDLVPGVEISSNGQKMSWSISEHLDFLDKDTQEQLA